MIKSKKGIALIIALILSVVSLMLIGMVLYISTQYTQLSGRLKLYVSALSAANGAYNITKTVLPSIKQKSSFDLSNISPLVGSREKCLHIKLTRLTQDWPAYSDWNYNNCPNITKATSTNDDDIINYYDLKYKLGNYYVFVKIVSSSLGNTFPRTLQLSSGGVTSHNEKLSPTFPYLYRLEILSERIGNSKDKVHISALFAY